jgi:hypothetical protein
MKRHARHTGRAARSCDAWVDMPARPVTELCRQTTSNATYIGRVGGLAVALGVGLAIATPGVAWAQPNDPGSSATADSAGSTNQATKTPPQKSHSRSPTSALPRRPRRPTTPKTEPGASAESPESDPNADGGSMRSNPSKKAPRMTKLTHAPTGTSNLRRSAMSAPQPRQEAAKLRRSTTEVGMQAGATQSGTEGTTTTFSTTQTSRAANQVVSIPPSQPIARPGLHRRQGLYHQYRKQRGVTLTAFRPLSALHRPDRRAASAGCPRSAARGWPARRRCHLP